MKFPKDFIQIPHPVIRGAKQWLLKVDTETIISVVGGGTGLYGDGITTFEMWDYREDYPQGHLSVDDINTHLKENPIH